MDEIEITVATFDKYADRYQSKFQAYDAYTETYETLCSLITLDHTDILDVACGPGNMTNYLLKKFPAAKIHGIDLAPRMIELARLTNPAATFELMDTRDIHRIDRMFDVLMCGFGLPYISPAALKTFIHDARSLLRNGGLMYLSTMEAQTYSGGYDTNKNGDQVYIHHHEFAFIESELKTSGFQIINLERKPYEKEDGETVTDLFVYAQVNK